MTAFKTTAVLEDARHLRLDQPLTDVVGQVLEVIVMVAEAPAVPASSRPDFQAALGSYYREHPTEERRGSDEWLAELREGEAD